MSAQILPSRGGAVAIHHCNHCQRGRRQAAVAKASCWTNGHVYRCEVCRKVTNGFHGCDNHPYHDNYNLWYKLRYHSLSNQRISMWVRGSFQQKYGQPFEDFAEHPDVAQETQARHQGQPFPEADLSGEYVIDEEMFELGQEADVEFDVGGQDRIRFAENMGRAAIEDNGNNKENKVPGLTPKVAKSKKEAMKESLLKKVTKMATGMGRAPLMKKEKAKRKAEKRSSKRDAGQ